MNGRVGIRMGGALAVLACAVLVACGGGGGGGGGGSIPSTPTPAPPASQSLSLTLSTTSSTEFSLGPVAGSSGGAVVSGATFTVPQVGVSSATGDVTMTATVPSGNPTPSARSVHFRVPNTLNVATTPVLYFALTVSKTVTVFSSPAIALSGVTVSQPCYLVVYDPTNPSAGWNGIAGPFTASNGTLTIPSASLNAALSVQAGKTYVFAVVTSGSTVPTPTPIPSATIAAGADAPMPALTPMPDGGWAPYQVASALQFPVMSGWSGAGKAIVIIGDATPNPADVSTFLTKFGLTSRAGGALKTVNIDGGVNGSGNPPIANDDQEATLDVETALSMAPGAIIEFYAMPDTGDQSFLDAEQYALTDPLKPAVVSESFGGCEGGSTPPDHTTIQTGVGKGIAFTASAGDNGNECYVSGSGANAVYTPGPNNPASDPYVIGVGGNENADAQHTALGSLTNPQVWNDDYLGGPGAGGGGVSALFTLPQYQNALAGIASPTMRNVPDISMPSEGVAIYYGGQWSQFGGTSWGAPEAAALIAQLDEYCGGLPADASPALFYNAFTRSSRSAFIDVTAGNNQFGSSTPYYRASVGYDDASGLGLPLGAAIATRICPSRTWSYGVRSQAMAIASYGQARDTQVAAAMNLHRLPDLGARSTSASTTISVVLRNTATLAQDEKTVIAALQSAGFQITRTYPTHMVIQAVAPASLENGYFRTAIHDVDQGRYGRRYANVAPVTVPAAIAPYVETVVANNLITRHRLSYRIR